MYHQQGAPTRAYRRDLSASVEKVVVSVASTVTSVWYAVTLLPASGRHERAHTGRRVCKKDQQRTGRPGNGLEKAELPPL